MLIEAKNHGDVRTTDRTRTSYTFQVTNRCGCDLCSAAIISRSATGTVGSRKFQLPLWVASCSVHGSPRPAVTWPLTWPRTFIMLHFATHTHDVPAFSSPAFSSPAFSASPTPDFHTHLYIYVFIRVNWSFKNKKFKKNKRKRDTQRVKEHNVSNAYYLYSSFRQKKTCKQTKNKKNRKQTQKNTWRGAQMPNVKCYKME